MFETVRDLGPVALIPAAWTATAAAHVGVLGTQAMFIAHLVMAGFIAFFAVTGWDAMATGALRAWRLVLVAGLGLTLTGIAGFLLPDIGTPLQATSLVGWMVLPAAGLVYTGREIPSARRVYYGGGALAVLGAVLYLGAAGLGADGLSLGALGVVALGQTAGIVDASLRS